MYLGNELPLVVKYNVASLGDIKLCLVPLPQEQVEQQELSDDFEY
jgi:hypothetical protein